MRRSRSPGRGIVDPLPLTSTTSSNAAAMEVSMADGTIGSGCGPNAVFAPQVGDMTLTLTGATIAPGATCTISVSVDLPIDTGGTWDNVTQGPTAANAAQGAPASASLMQTVPQDDARRRSRR